MVAVKTERKIIASYEWREVMKCLECRDGELKAQDTVQTSYPPQFPHQCTHCDYSETFHEIYPRSGVRHEYATTPKQEEG